VLERAVMVLALALMVFANSWPTGGQAVRAAAGAVSGFALLGGSVALLIVCLVADRLARWVQVSATAPLPGASAASTFALGVRNWCLSRWSLPTFALAVAGNLNIVLSGMLLGAGLHLPLQALDYLAVIPTALLAMVLPVSMGGWGLREGVIVALLAGHAIAGPTALAFSVAFGLVFAASSAPGLIFLWHPSRDGFFPRLPERRA